MYLLEKQFYLSDDLCYPNNFNGLPVTILYGSQQTIYYASIYLKYINSFLRFLKRFKFHILAATTQLINQDFISKAYSGMPVGREDFPSSRLIMNSETWYVARD